MRATHSCPPQEKRRASCSNWLPKQLGISTNAMIMPDSFVQARLRGWGVILACIAVPVAIAFLVLTLVDMRYQSAAIAVLVAAANQKMHPGSILQSPLLTALAEVGWAAAGVLSIVLIVVMVCVAIGALL